MAMIVGGLAAIAQVGAAVGEVVTTVRRMNNEHDAQMAVISNQHQHAMAVLNNQQISENNRHKEFMALLGILFQAVSILGKDIFEAEYEGCKGLPGNKRLLI